MNELLNKYSFDRRNFVWWRQFMPQCHENICEYGS